MPATLRRCKDCWPKVPNATDADHADMTDEQDPSPPSIDPRVERSRTAVVEAAAKLLLDEGPDAITHARVADAAAVSRTTVYKHYPERTDLLFATAEAIGKNLPDAASIIGDLRTDLATLLDHLATDLRDPIRTRVIALMMERSLHDDAVALVRDTFLDEIGQAFAAIIATGVEAGVLAADTDADLGLAALVGALIFSRFLASVPVDEQLVTAMIENFIRTNAPR